MGPRDRHVQVKYKGVYEKLAFVHQYLALFRKRYNISYGHSYNGSRIGIRMRSIEWCHFK